MRKPIKGYFSTLNMLPNTAIYFLLKTINTDLVVIEVYAFQQLPRVRELWIKLRAGKIMEFSPVHEISKTFAPPVCDDNSFFMLLAVATSHLHQVETITSHFLNPGKIVQR